MATTVGDRLREARETLQRLEGEKRPNRAKFAREIGMQPPSLYELEAGESKEPSGATLLKLRDRGINPDYIMRDKGPMLIDNVERHMNKQEMLGLMDDMDDETQAALVSMARTVVRKQPGGGSKADPFKKKPPE